MPTEGRESVDELDGFINEVAVLNLEELGLLQELSLTDHLLCAVRSDLMQKIADGFQLSPGATAEAEDEYYKSLIPDYERDLEAELVGFAKDVSSIDRMQLFRVQTLAIHERSIARIKLEIVEARIKSLAANAAAGRTAIGVEHARETHSLI